MPTVDSASDTSMLKKSRSEVLKEYAVRVKQIPDRLNQNVNDLNSYKQRLRVPRFIRTDKEIARDSEKLDMLLMNALIILNDRNILIGNLSDQKSDVKSHVRSMETNPYISPIEAAEQIKEGKNFLSTIKEINSSLSNIENDPFISVIKEAIKEKHKLFKDNPKLMQVEIYKQIHLISNEKFGLSVDDRMKLLPEIMRKYYPKDKLPDVFDQKELIKLIKGSDDDKLIVTALCAVYKEQVKERLLNGRENLTLVQELSKEINDTPKLSNLFSKEFEAIEQAKEAKNEQLSESQKIRAAYQTAAQVEETEMRSSRRWTTSKAKDWSQFGKPASPKSSNDSESQKIAVTPTVAKEVKVVPDKNEEIPRAPRMGH